MYFGITQGGLVTNAEANTLAECGLTPLLNQANSNPTAFLVTYTVMERKCTFFRNKIKQKVTLFATPAALCSVYTFKLEKARVRGRKGRGLDLKCTRSDLVAVVGAQASAIYSTVEVWRGCSKGSGEKQIILNRDGEEGFTVEVMFGAGPSALGHTPLWHSHTVSAFFSGNAGTPALR